MKSDEAHEFRVRPGLKKLKMKNKAFPKYFISFINHHLCIFYNRPSKYSEPLARKKQKICPGTSHGVLEPTWTKKEIT
jgi:hypothetical protein